MDPKERALRHYLAEYNAIANAMFQQIIGYNVRRCDFCGRPLAEHEMYRHQPCNTLSQINFGARL